MPVGSIADAVTQLKQISKSLSFSDIQVGTVCEGYIESICQYGAFIDMGGVTVFVHRTCLLNPSEFPLDFYTPGNQIMVRVTEIDCENRRIFCEEYRP